MEIAVEHETGKRIKTLRTDNGTEYTNKEFTKFMTDNEIKHQKKP